MNIKNIKTKRKYIDWLIEARGLAESTSDKMIRSVDLYEEFTGYKDFNTFSLEKAKDFKKWLRCRKYKSKPLAFNSYRTYLIHLKTFFEWLITQPGYKSKITSDSLEYLRITKKESRVVAQNSIRKFPYMEYVRNLADSIEGQNDVQLRNRALISFAFLTGMRDGAIVSLPLKSIDMDKLIVFQNPVYGVKTKFSKTIYSKIFNFDEKLLKYFTDWHQHLLEIGFSSNDPVFPRSKSSQGENSLSFEESTEIEPVFWESTSSMRDIFKKTAIAADLPYYRPHAFRHSAIYYALKITRNGDEYKAVSQNFGHEDVSTTLSVYAQYEPEKLIEVLSNLNYSGNQEIKEKDLWEAFKNIVKQNMSNS